LRPADAAIPSNRDSTNHSDALPYNAANPYWVGLDVENGYIFTAIHTGFEIWDARSSPSAPNRVAQVDGRTGGFPTFPAAFENKFPVHDVDAPEGNDDVIAVAAADGVGLSIWNTSIKGSPRAVYQDFGDANPVKGVYATTIGGNSYAFGASEGRGLMVYDMTMAAARSSACVETTSQSVQCGGIWRGKLGSRTNVSYVAGAGPLVAFSSGVSPGVELWNVSNPGSPSFVTTLIPSTIAFGVAMWSQGGSYYLAVRASGTTELRIYDVSCAATGGCGSIGNPLATVPNGDTGAARYFVTFSRSGSTPFLHLGSEALCGGSRRQEWLYDVSNPASPRDITPPDGVAEGYATGYWNWYYRATPTGFNRVAPRRAKFYGDYLYHAATTLFDIHRRSGGAPAPNFNWSPSEVFPGTPVNFLDASGGSPTSWAWTFQGGSPASSAVQNPSGVTFATSGTKLITLEVCNNLGCDSTSRNLSVIGPGAGVADVTVSPASVTSCQSVSFTATGVTGQAPISYAWTVLTPAGGEIAVPSCGGNPCSWVVPADATSGTYRAQVRVSNSANPGGSIVSRAFSLTQQALAVTSTNGAPTADPTTGATVQFHVQSTGASEWAWDFDDDGNPSTPSFGAYSSNPTTGPNPQHTYSSSGTKYVKVRVRSCTGAVVESNALAIEVNTEGTLTAAFSALNCTFGVCSFSVGQLIGFADNSTGSPDTWAYDWNNTSTSASNCNYSAPGGSPVTSHVYTSAGTYRPCLRVTRGAQSSAFVHKAISVSSSTGNPAIFISGPSGGTVNQPLTFSASAANCTPSSGGWQWSTEGGVGSSTSNSITVSWPSAGTKTVSVTNGGCSGASATQQITISVSSGGVLVAAYSYSPTTIFAGQAVNFDGSASQGGPTTYQWNFGDSSGEQNGSVVQHTFAAAGSYQVKLSVAKPGTGTGCSLGFCTDDETKTVVVQQSANGTCAGDSDALCLGGGRFKVKVAWKVPDGSTGIGHPIAITDDTGYFWFFDIKNVEVVTKVLNGCGVNGSYWVFAAGLTNVEATMTVTDQQTGAVEIYSNAQGKAFNPIQDTGAFSCSGSKALMESFGGEVAAEPVEYVEINEGDPIPAGKAYILSGTKEVAPFAVCTPGNNTLCLNNGRFRVDASWSTPPPNGAVGLGQAVALTGDTGYFWFFNSANVEIIIKVLNGCGINANYWVFAGGLTNVEVAITVTDTTTGTYKTYFNPQGTAFQPQQDTKAIANCP
ncbi:MAG: PKD domain-containing protein, partial [Thermoanaerobaculia bacterium]|nr:PKD domain-containing protein [Thermoanaerobaculia bacterium]